MKTLVVGAGKSGVASANFLAARGERVLLADSAKEPSLPVALDTRVERAFGRDDVALLDDVTTIVVSPGVPLTIPLLQQAATRAIVSMYAAGRAPSGGLVFARDAAVLPALGENVPELVALDVGGGQRFSAGLLPARTPTSFEVITVGPARQRLVVTRTTDGALEVANGLGATMTSLVVRDRDGAWQLPAPVVAGGTAVLRRGQSSRALVSPEHPAFFRF